jgi:hypothetical protein
MAVTCRPDTFGSVAAPLRHATAGAGDPGAGEVEGEREGLGEGPAAVGVRPVGRLAADVAEEVAVAVA